MDAKGDLYLYKNALLCKDEIIKRLINGTYHLADGNTSSVGNSIGKSSLERLCFPSSSYRLLL